MRLLFEIWDINWIDDSELQNTNRNEWMNEWSVSYFSLAINVTAQNAG